MFAATYVLVSNDGNRLNGQFILWKAANVKMHTQTHKHANMYT